MTLSILRIFLSLRWLRYAFASPFRHFLFIDFHRVQCLVILGIGSSFFTLQLIEFEFELIVTNVFWYLENKITGDSFKGTSKSIFSVK